MDAESFDDITGRIGVLRRLLKERKLDDLDRGLLALLDRVNLLDPAHEE